MMKMDLQLFGGRGSGGSRNSGGVTAASVQEDIKQFWDELKDREYGESHRMVPEKQQKEYRAAKRELQSAEESFDGPITLAGGFATDDNYIHSTAKLNSYQRLVRSDVQATNHDLKLGIINAEQAAKELRTEKNLDLMIQQRRKLLKEW